jgi:hypothetical protein
MLDLPPNRRALRDTTAFRKQLEDMTPEGKTGWDVVDLLLYAIRLRECDEDGREDGGRETIDWVVNQIEQGFKVQTDRRR